MIIHTRSLRKYITVLYSQAVVLVVRVQFLYYKNILERQSPQKNFNSPVQKSNLTGDCNSEKKKKK